MELKKLAQDAAAVYMQNPKVESVLLGGSVARNLHDEFSDIELFIFWKEAPADEDRKAPINQLAGELLVFHSFEDDEWAETYTVQYIKLEISSFLSSTVNEYIQDVISRYNTNYDKQVLLASIKDGAVLGGETAISELKRQIAQYPKDLAGAMIRENRELGSRWQNREALVAREDWLMLYHVFVNIEVKLMGILFALNDEYVHHPAFKWQNRTLEKLKILPENSRDRFAAVLLGEPQKGVGILEGLVSETFQLAQKVYPDLDWSEAMEKALWTRPKNQ